VPRRRLVPPPPSLPAAAARARGRSDIVSPKIFRRFKLSSYPQILNLLYVNTARLPQHERARRAREEKERDRERDEATGRKEPREKVE